MSKSKEETITIITTVADYSLWILWPVALVAWWLQGRAKP